MPNSSRKVTEFDEKRNDAIFAEVNQCQLPGAAVGIAIDGRPVYRQGFGLANIEQPLLLTPTTRMRIGSISKHFTAFAYMLLCEEGKAGIDDPIGKFLPELHPVTHSVTMRQLMGNTSGLREAADLVCQFSGADSRRIITTADLLSLYEKVDDANTAPGVTYNYNNGGWVILSVAIERITEKPLEEVLRKRVFEPIGMVGTLLRRWDSDFVPNSASCHAADVPPAEVLRSGAVLPGSRYTRAESFGGIDGAGAGSIVSTVDDMLRWMAHMERPTVGGAATWKLMTSSQVLLNGTPTGYGLGLNIGRHRGLDSIQHGGGVQGGNAQMIKIPSAGLDIIVIVNRGDASSFGFAERILDACVPDAQPEHSEKVGGPFVRGTFRSFATGNVVHLFEANGRQMASLNCHEIPMQIDQHGNLRTEGAFATLQYTICPIGDPQNPHAIHFEEFGNRDELIAVKPTSRDSSRELVGRYRSDSTDTDVTILDTGRGLTMSSRGRFGTAVHHVEPLAEHIWRTTPENLLILPPWGMILADSDGTGFRFSNASNQNLRFRKAD